MVVLAVVFGGVGGGIGSRWWVLAKVDGGVGLVCCSNGRWWCWWLVWVVGGDGGGVGGWRWWVGG